MQSQASWRNVPKAAVCQPRRIVVKFMLSLQTALSHRLDRISLTNAAQTSAKLDRKIFDAAIDLMISQPWLQSKKREFSELLAFSSDENHQALLIDLLLRTKHLTRDQFGNAIDRMREQVEDVWSLDPATTSFVSSNSKQTTDSSQEILNLLKSTHWTNSGWQRNQFYIKFKESLNSIPKNGTVVIVDDFIGSGNTILKAAQWFSDEKAKSGKQFDLKVLAVAGCSEGLRNIQAAAYDVFSVLTVPKGISDHFTGADLHAAKIWMTEIENALAASGKPATALDKYRFGWEKQEAVYVRDGGNTPNNVFPIFWWKWSTRGNATVMHRT